MNRSNSMKRQKCTTFANKSLNVNTLIMKIIIKLKTIVIILVKQRYCT